MKKINFYVVQNLIEELSFIRYSLVNKEEHFEDFLMAAKVGSNLYIASRLNMKEMTEKLKEVFVGDTGAIPEFAIFDATQSIMNDSIVIETQDNEISKLKRIFRDIRRANKMAEKDSYYFGPEDEESETPSKPTNEVRIPTLDELLDKISENGMDSLDKFEKKLLSDYSNK